MKPSTSGGGWAAIRYTLRMANRVGWLPAVAGDAQPQRLQDLRARHGRPAGRHGQRGRPLARGLQEVAPGDGRRHAGRASRRSSSRATRSPSCARCRRASWNGAAGSPTPLYAGPGDTHYRVDRLGRGARPRSRRSCRRRRPDEQLLLRQRPLVERGRLPAAALRAAVRHQLRQQLLVLLPPGQRRRPRRDARHRHGDRHARRRRAQRPVRPHRRQPGVEPSAPDAEPDADPPPRRARHRHQPGEGSRPGQLPRALRSAEPAVRLDDRQPVRAAAHRRRHRAADRRRQGCARARRSTIARSSSRHTEGFDAFARQVEATAVGRRSSAARGVDRATIDRASPTCTARRRTSSSAGRWASRITCTASTTCGRSSTSRCCAAWSAGRAPGCCRSAGTATCRAWARSASRRSSSRRCCDDFEQHLGVQAADARRASTRWPACEAAGRGEMKVGALPRRQPVRQQSRRGVRRTRAIGKLDLVAYLSTTLNTGHAWGAGEETLILPVLARDEEPQPTTQESMFNYVRLSDGGPPRHRGTAQRGRRSSPTLGRARARRRRRRSTGRELESHAAIRELIAELIPGYEPMAEIDRTKAGVSHRRPHVSTQPTFPTPSGQGAVPRRSPLPRRRAGD